MVHQTLQSSDMQRCIEDCKQCHDLCLRTAMTFCLQEGGKHTEQDHFRLMINCAEICQTSANFMLSNSPFHGAVCTACADVCAACAESCEQIGDMDECARICHVCAQSCGEMAQTYQPRTSGIRSSNVSTHTNA